MEPRYLRIETSPVVISRASEQRGHTLKALRHHPHKPTHLIETAPEGVGLQPTDGGHFW